MNQGNTEDARVIALCQSAFHAEHRSQFQEAYKLHGEAVTGLHKLVNDAGFFDRGRKRVARKQIKFHSARMQIVKPIVDGKQQKLAIVLPTSISAEEELRAIRPNGSLSIGLEELWLAKHLTDRTANPAPPVDPAMQYLLQTPALFLTPTLDPNLPNISYHIYASREAVFIDGHLYYLKVKSETDDRQTLYVLQARKRRRYQIGLATLHRAAEFTSPCVQVQITGVRPSGSGILSAIKGRPMQLYTRSSRVIREDPDRLENTSWGPRRFTYAGRQFVWETENKNEYHPQTLYEVEKVWPKPGSKTGKKEHKAVGRKLCWGEAKVGLKKVAVIYMVGGLDQLFREYLLASQLARLAVVFYGHD